MLAASVDKKSIRAFCRWLSLSPKPDISTKEFSNLFMDFGSNVLQTVAIFQQFWTSVSEPNLDQVPTFRPFWIQVALEMTTGGPRSPFEPRQTWSALVGRKWVDVKQGHDILKSAICRSICRKTWQLQDIAEKEYIRPTLAFRRGGCGTGVPRNLFVLKPLQKNCMHSHVLVFGSLPFWNHAFFGIPFAGLAWGEHFYAFWKCCSTWKSALSSSS